MNFDLVEALARYPFNRVGAEEFARRLGIARDAFYGGQPPPPLPPPRAPRNGRRRAARMRRRGY